MSHTIPVFFFQINRERIPAKLESWLDAENILGEQVESYPRESYWVSSSRNWWHQDATIKICKRLGIPGLQFTLDEVACLCNGDLDRAISALDTLLLAFSAGVPDLGPIDPKDGTLLWLTRGIKNNQPIDLSTEEMKNAFEEAQATNDVDEGSAVGYKALVGYYSFLKSLRQAILVAIDDQSCLLYVMPQP